MNWIVYATVGLAWSVVMYLVTSRRRLRALREVRRKQIAALRDGERGKVVGHARMLDEHLIAPLSGRRCLYYIVKVVEHGLLNDKKTIINEARAVVFGLEDDSGRAIIDPMGAEVVLNFDHNNHTGTFRDPTDRERAFLASHDEDVQGYFLDRSLYYREAVIADGEQIAVLGSGTREPDPDAQPTAAYRGDQPTRLRLTSSVKHPLVISDDPDVLG